VCFELTPISRVQEMGGSSSMAIRGFSFIKAL